MAVRHTKVVYRFCVASHFFPMAIREVIHLSIGSEACEVNAHLSNLTGLAGTSQWDDHESPCNPGVTHRILNDIYVPRTILIDRPREFRRQQRRFFANTNHQDEMSPEDFVAPSLWGGGVEQLAVGSEDDKDGLVRFFQDASVLAQSSYSRYRVPSTNNSSISSFKASSNGRHVDWDAIEEQEQGEAEEARGQQRTRVDTWYTETLRPTQRQLDKFWTAEVDAVNPKPFAEQQTLESPCWTDYWMPPYHPKSCLPLPHDSDAVADWDSYNSGYKGLSETWKEDKLLESIRSVLEECDSCQGVVLFSSLTQSGWETGLSTLLLQELQDECPSAHRLVIPIESLHSNEDEKDATSSSTSWASKRTNKVRCQINRSLAVHQFKDLAHTVMPLCHPQKMTKYGLAVVAMALETTTLPYRLRSLSTSNERSLVGVNALHCTDTGNYDVPFGTAPKLSFRSFLNHLKPSSEHSFAELSILSPPKMSSIDEILWKGTSLDIDHRARQPPAARGMSTPRAPGEWLSLETNWMTMSPQGRNATVKALDRSLHRNFCLSSSLRPNEAGELSSIQYVQCMMEGMGIRCRPEHTLGTVLRQSIDDLVRDGYGAGSYWKDVRISSFDDTKLTQSPVLSMVGNTTRSFFYFDDVALDTKEALSQQFRQFFGREVQQDRLPELDECREALTTCWDVRDAYMPPDGSGLVSLSGQNTGGF